MVGFDVRTTDPWGWVFGAPAAQLEQIKQHNQIGDWYSGANSSGIVSITVDPTKLAANHGVALTVYVTCAKVAA